jgi:lipoprotein-anchoring transpeptidase ErfK/SrfK
VAPYEVAGQITPSLSARAKAAILAGSVLFASTVGAYGYERMSSSVFYPGTRIGGLLIGSRTPDEAKTLLHDAFAIPLHREVEISAPDFKVDATPWDMGMRVDVNDIVRDALVRQQVEPFPSRLWHRILGTDDRVRLHPNVNEKLFGAFLEKMYKQVNQDPVDARLEVVHGKLHVVPHKVGRKVSDELAERSVFEALTSGAKKVDLPVSIEQPVLRTEDFTRVILISTTRNVLKLYDHNKLAKQYRVATGTGGYPTPHGQFRIVAKREWPTWYNPHAPWSVNMPDYIPPGRNNPLGTRAMYLSANGIRIHGTPQDDSIGSNASHGCIRMHIPDAEDLFKRVKVGTPVLVVY